MEGDPLTVVRGVLERDGKLLLLRRSPDTRYGSGRVHLPGGSVEAGESHENALEREFEEELGSVLERSEYLFSLESPKQHEDDLAVSPHFYRVEVDDIEPVRLNEESTAYGWVPFEECSRYDYAFEHREAVGKYLTEQADRPYSEL